MNYKVFTLFLLMLLFSCSKKSEVNNPRTGEITIATDESFKNVAEALTERYMAFYPETKINIKVEKEDFAFKDLIEEKVNSIILGKELTEREINLYTEKFKIKYQPAKFAGDAVVFIVSKNAERQNISVEELKKELLSEEKNIIFDGANTSNFNFVTQKLGLKPKEVKFSVIKGNKNVIENINKYTKSIGVISLNSISRPYDPIAKELRDKIKILPIVQNNVNIEPSIENIRNVSYPFTRILYFLTNEGYFGLGNGLIRFSCTQIGQIVVKKQGLQPYNIYKREVQMK